MIVVAVVGSIFVLKLVLSQKKAFIVNGIETASIIAALANAIQIQVGEERRRVETRALLLHSVVSVLPCHRTHVVLSCCVVRCGDARL